jgi:hypothetical protein
MARKRMISPEFWEDETLGECTRDERLLFMGLISNADDEGRGRANAKLVKANIFPYDEDISSKDIKKMMSNLASKKFIVLYSVDGQEFYWVRTFKKHQSVNRPQESKLPPPPDIDYSNIDSGDEIKIHEYISEDSVNHHEQLTPNIKERKLKEKKIKYAEFVSLSEDEYNKLVSEYGEQQVKRMIEILDNYKGSTGRTYKSDYRAILNWVVDRIKKERFENIVSIPKKTRADCITEAQFAAIEAAENERRNRSELNDSA